MTGMLYRSSMSYIMLRRHIKNLSNIDHHRVGGPPGWEEVQCDTELMADDDIL